MFNITKKIICLFLLFSFISYGYIFAQFENFGSDLKPTLDGVSNVFNSDESLDKLQKTTQLGNIYDYAYEMAKNSELSSEKESLDYVTSYLQSKGGNCSVSSNDVYNVFGNSFQGKTLSYFSYLSSNKNTPALTEAKQQSDKFVQSCKKISECMGQTIESSENYSADTYVKCMNIVTNLQGLVAPTIKGEKELKTANYGDEIFANGTIEDSPYDLLVDVENIGKLFFRDNKSPKKISFYGKSKNKNGLEDEEDRMKLDIFGNTDSLFDKFIKNKQKKSGNSNMPTVSDNGSTNSGGNSDNNINGVLGNSSVVSDSQSILNGTCVNGCYPNQTTLTDSGINDLSFENDQTTGGSSYYSDYDVSSLNLLLNNGSNFGAGIVKDPRKFIFGSGFEALEGIDESALNACVSRCDGLSSFDKAVCKARCLCGGSSSQDDIYKINFCFEPSKKRPVASSKSAMSIEEILDEINNNLLNMKESGALMVHTKPTEMLETALAKIDLSSIMSFSTVIDKKPVFTMDKTEKDKKKQEAVAKATNKKYEEEVLKMYDPDIKEGRNAYMVLANPDKSDAYRGPGTDPSVVQTRVDRDAAYSAAKSPTVGGEDNIKDVEKTSNFTVFNIIQRFIDYNDKFLDDINQHLNSANGIAKNMKNKRS